MKRLIQENLIGAMSGITLMCVAWATTTLITTQRDIAVLRETQKADTQNLQSHIDSIEGTVSRIEDFLLFGKRP